MRSLSSHLAEFPATDADALAAMRRRFIEALRRAEIIALVNAADNEEQLGRSVSEELCEAFDAEVALVVAWRRGQPGRLIGSTGVDPRPEPVLSDALRGLELGSERAIAVAGVSLGDIRADRSMVIRSSAGRDAHAGLLVARLYERDFEPPELALLEAVAVSVGHALERLWARDNLEEASFAIAAALANAMEAHDVDTAGHAQEIAKLAVGVGAHLGLSEDELRELRLGAILHDIGKIAVRTELLQKPGPLTEVERREVQSHAAVGEQILSPIPFLCGVRRLVRHSHERWDGTGYPDGLRGEETPLGARIICVVDAWHAMISDRPYQAAIDEHSAAEELLGNAGSQFDPAVVAAFFEIRASAGLADRSGLEPPPG